MNYVIKQEHLVRALASLRDAFSSNSLISFGDSNDELNGQTSRVSEHIVSAMDALAKIEDLDND